MPVETIYRPATPEEAADAQKRAEHHRSERRARVWFASRPLIVIGVVLVLLGAIAAFVGGAVVFGSVVALAGAALAGLATMSWFELRGALREERTEWDPPYDVVEVRVQASAVGFAIDAHDFTERWCFFEVDPGSWRVVAGRDLPSGPGVDDALRHRSVRWARLAMGAPLWVRGEGAVVPTFGASSSLGAARGSAEVQADVAAGLCWSPPDDAFMDGEEPQLRGADVPAFLRRDP
jgi:hypothetical protein